MRTLVLVVACVLVKMLLRLLQRLGNATRYEHQKSGQESLASMLLPTTSKATLIEDKQKMKRRGRRASVPHVKNILPFLDTDRLACAGVETETGQGLSRLL